MLNGLVWPNTFSEIDITEELFTTNVVSKQTSLAK